MNTTNKSGLRRMMTLFALAAFILTLSSCGSGRGHGGCGAYGNPKAPNTHSEQISE